MKVSKVALAAATALGASALLGTPALAQQQNQQAASGEAQQPQRTLNLSRNERTALAPLEAAVRGQDWAAAQAALPAAQAAAQGPDARYFVGRATWRIADATQNRQLEMQALDALLAAGVATPANERPIYLNRQAELAFAANDFARAERAFVQLLELTPNDTRVQNNLAIVRRRMGNNAGATETLLQAIQRQEAAGQRPELTTYTSAVSSAYRARQREQTLDLLRRLIRAYPTAAHWRDAINIYREFSNADTALSLDSLRLLRAARALDRQDYLPFAGALEQAGLPGETKAVVDEAVAAGALQAGSADVTRLLATANRRIAEDRSGLDAQIAQARRAADGRLARVMADTLFGYARYAEAAELYRLALSKGGEDSNLINTRLGATLALAGQRAEAEAALRAVTGPRAELAQFWLVWLQSRPA